jgi:MFS family permease
MRGLSRDSGVRLGWTLALTSLAFFIVGLDALVVVTALAAIQTRSSRVVQGIGAGFIMPLSLTILTSAFGPERCRTVVGKASGVNIAGFRPSFTVIAGLAVIGALAAFGVGNAPAVARASSRLDVGAAPAR